MHAPRVCCQVFRTPPHPRRLGVGKTKNVETNVFGETLGRLHMERQDFSKLNQRKGKAVRLEKKRKAPEDGDGGGDGDGAGESPEAAAAAQRAAAIAAAMGELQAEEGAEAAAAAAGEKAPRRASKKARTVKGSSGEFDA